MIDLQPPSGRAEFAGMASYFSSEIAPYLRSKEIERAQAVTNFFIIVGALALLAAAVLFAGPFGEANLQIGVVIGFGALAGGLALLNRTRDDIAHGLIARICGKLGFNYRLDAERPHYYQQLRDLRLLPDHDSENWEDEVRGVHAGAGFSMCEAHLKKKSSGKNRSERTVFHGQVFAVDYPKAFLGRTVVTRDMGPLNAFLRPGREFARVGIASARFEKFFEAWSTDQVEARDLLDPVVLERFEELERLYCGKKLRAAFAGGRLYLAIETGDRLNMGSMFEPLENPKRVETILKEFDVIFDLIDVLLKRIAGAMTGAFSVENVKEVGSQEP